MPDQSIGDAFQRHRAHQWIVRARPAAERKRRLQALLSAIVSRRETLFEAMHADFRKNRTESELSEIQLVLTELREAIAHVEEWARPVRVPTPAHLLGTDSEIRYEPRGVVLIMAAWNYPFALIFAPLAGAVAAGNCIMIRPSERVPHTNAVSRAILTDVFPPDELTFVEGGRDTADALLALPFDHVFFTGSTPVGRAIMAAAAPHVSSVTLELGGKSPAIVDESADIDEAATRIMWGKFVNAGQTCVAPDYAIVHASRAKAFFDAARAALASFYGATPEARRASDDYCRIIDPPSWTRLTSLIDEAVARGATIEIGGDRDASDLYLAPTLLSNVDLASPIMADEIFGPILPVLTFQSIDEAIAIVRARPKPLAMYAFGRDRARLETVLQSTSSGGTVINNCLIHLLNPSLPFGGAGGSGFGSYHGRFGFEAFSHARAVVTQGRPNMTRFFRPPYARLRSGWLGQTLAFVRRLRE